MIEMISDEMTRDENMTYLNILLSQPVSGKSVAECV